MPHAVIEQVNCIAIEGIDARRFAQSQFSGDLRTLAPGHWQWNAWLDPQGRVAALLHLVDAGDGGLLAVLRGGNAGEMHAQLARYLLRSQTALSQRIFRGYADAALAPGRLEKDRHDLVLGFGERSLRLSPTRTPVDAPAANGWRLADIRAGWPVLPTEGTRFLPPALGLERLGAVSFDKGCFPGQEIAARLHFRGGHKQQLGHLRGTAPLPAGPIPGKGAAGSLYVLDCVPSPQDTVEALVVAPKSGLRSINVLGNAYEFLSRFEV
ncbi:MAG TPA: folate-binding protein [Rhodanobacteraceae bacterium]|nr:folate-binding protein [Rhodanobacteraceae bacterium]